MPSRLSSLLVRDGLVGVKRMEKAFQRQVIYGGSLDTILLEMNLVPEERLTQYLALASGLPPAARDEGTAIGADAIAADRRRSSRSSTARCRSRSTGEALRILVCSPLEIDELEDLADLLDRPLQPLITPEYRWHLVFASAYGVEPPARFTTLARSLDVEAPATPVGRARSVIVDERARRPMTNPPPMTPVPPSAVAPPVLPAPPVTSVMGAPASPIAPIAPHEDTLRMSTTEVEAAIGGAVLDAMPGGRAHSATLMGVEPNRAQTESARVPAPPAVATPSPPLPVIGKPARDSAARAASRRSERAMKPLQRPRADSAPIATRRAATARSPIVRARELLATADDRDTVFLTLLRAARARARWAGLLTVQGGAAIGRVALAEHGHRHRRRSRAC